MDLSASGLRDEVHVWYCFTSRVPLGDLAQDYLALLSPGERARHARFVRRTDRDHYLVAHALLRTSLSRYGELAPEEWTFATTDHGRPYLPPPRGALRFNLSHTDGLVACAVTADREVGVDVECSTRLDDVMELAADVFAPSELEPLRRLPPDGRRDRFFQLWTLKEAYIKARGLGLSLPLDRFWFDLDGELGFGTAPELADDAASWQFCSRAPGPRHWLAVAVRSGPARLRVRARHTIPRLVSTSEPL